MQAVAHQQLNGTAANTILTRFKKLFSQRRFPKPEDLASVTDEQIRACGFSFAKIRAIRDIAAKTLDGTIPSSRAIAKLGDEEIIVRLTEARDDVRWKKLPQIKVDYATSEYGGGNTANSDAWEECRSFSHNFGYNWTEESDPNAILSDKACIDQVMDIIDPRVSVIVLKTE